MHKTRKEAGIRMYKNVAVPTSLYCIELRALNKSHVKSVVTRITSGVLKKKIRRGLEEVK